MRYWELIAPLDENGDPLNEQASFGATNAASIAVLVKPFGSPNPTGDMGIYADNIRKKKKKKTSEDSKTSAEPKVTVLKRIQESKVKGHWDHYTDVGHKKGSTVWYILKTGKLVTADYERKKDNHNEDIERDAVAVGRIDPKQKKISIRPPIVSGNSPGGIPDKQFKRIVARFEKSFPDYEIWYFGVMANQIYRVDQNAPNPNAHDDFYKSYAKY